MIGGLPAAGPHNIAGHERASPEGVVLVHVRARAVEKHILEDGSLHALAHVHARALLLKEAVFVAEAARPHRAARLVARRAVDPRAWRLRRVGAVRVAPQRNRRITDLRQLASRDGGISIPTR